MKAVFFFDLFIMVFFFSCVQKGEKNVGEEDSLSLPTTVQQPDRMWLSKWTPHDIPEIQRMYGSIISLIDQNKLDTLSFAYNCKEEKRGKVTYYAKEDKLLVIEHQYNEYDHYEAIDRYYIQNDSVYFAFFKGTYWSFASGEGVTKDDIKERRIYIVKGSPIKCLEKKYSIHSDSSENTDSDAITNMEVDCVSAKSIDVPFQLLKKYYKHPTSGCLE
ncbi:hypothetical protein [Sphingobacterium chuzhouense]|uniref:Lipoprotein n=1 Tax=Sphingobacterium chuzhouense TaxID=1742264 RepID=A0ABR7XUU8_9SPHI|nr:hypothetical protein [Sphingobacterium chuzhouense]MBD1422830.1 hypothetical protein [Sphingobacterium chuzhouense]